MTNVLSPPPPYSPSRIALGAVLMLLGSGILIGLLQVAASWGLGLAVPLLISMVAQLFILTGGVMIAHGGAFRRSVLRGLALGAGVTAAMVVGLAGCHRPFNPHVVPPHVNPVEPVAAAGLSAER